MTDKLASDFTCISCRMLFATPDDQRDHYKSELHRFNLKRKVLDLPPVTNDTFLQKVEALKVEETNKQQVSKLECQYCNKSFSSDGPYQQHLQSKKHKLAVDSGVTPKPVRIKQPKSLENQPQTLEEAERLIEEKIKNTPKLPLEHCLFCRHVSKNVNSSVKHMAREHSFFIPDIEYLVDLDGLIRFMSDKINIGNICLYCNGKGKQFESLEAVQAHMVELCHCKMNYDTQENSDEYIEYYDFSKSYADPSNPDAELNDQNKIIITDHELILPDGSAIGHRDYAIYYKQHYRQTATKQTEINRIIGKYKTLGWSQPTTNQDQLTKKDLHRRNIMALKVGIKKNNQRHHRQQLLVQ